MATTTKLYSTKWFSDLDIEEYSMIHQYHMNSLVGDVPQSLSCLNNNTTCYNFDDSCNDVLVEDKPSKILKTTHTSPMIYPLAPSKFPSLKHEPSSKIISFDKTNFEVMNYKSPHLASSPNGEEAGLPDQWKADLKIRGTKRAQSLTRSQSNAQEHHILSERKRREKLTQRFVALSALIPGLKKMDKASVLRDARKHIKHLQESVKEYEEQKKERTIQSMVLVKKSQLVLDDSPQPSLSSSDENLDCTNSNLPEIEVRVSGKDVLIKIICEKQKGHAIKIMEEIEKLGFSITNSNVLPFGPTFDISIIAQKNSDLDMKIEDIVKNLSWSLSKLL